MTSLKRAEGALWAAFCGDALAMPVHWYYNIRDIQTDFGRIADFKEPKSFHPTSIMNVSNTGGHGRGDQRGNIIGGVILHDKKQFWGRSGIHYHQGMKAGENTLNALVARVLMRSVTNQGQYQPLNFLQDYIKYMTTPGTHNDTYAESFHRDFFKNWAEGKDPLKCAGVEDHNTASMGGLVMIPPILCLYHRQPEVAEQKAVEHMSLTHQSGRLADHVRVYARIFCQVMNSERCPLPPEQLRAIIYKQCKEDLNLDLRPLVEKYSGRGDVRVDASVVGGKFSSACYIDDSLPSLLFLAAKYADSVEEALIANTNVGGENCHRGFALGALMGAAHGIQGIPKRWIDGLDSHDELSKEIQAFASLCDQK
jgi:ADP-ribosylglycohydrolase